MAAETVDHPWYSDEIPIIVNSGRLAFEKNQAHLLKAFVLVKKKRPCRLVLIGDGEERDALSLLASNLGIRDDVLFLGYQKNPFKFIARSRVFAFPSLFDAQSLVMLESMAVGCPIVAYDCPVGPREMLAPGTTNTTGFDRIEDARYGVLVPLGNIELFAHAIMRLVDDPGLWARYSRLAEERASHFNMQDMADRYYRVIASAALRKPGPGFTGDEPS